MLVEIRARALVRPSVSHIRMASIHRHGPGGGSGPVRMIVVSPALSRQAGASVRPEAAGSASGPWPCVDRSLHCQKDPCGASAVRSARSCVAGRRSWEGPETANCQPRFWREKHRIIGDSSRAEKGIESKRPRDTYGGSSFCLRETRTRTRNRPGSRILSHPFPQCLGGRFSVDGREEGADPSSPELMALGFREVGVSNQECIAIPGDGPREEFIVGVVGHGGVGRQMAENDGLSISTQSWWDSKGDAGNL